MSPWGREVGEQLSPSQLSRPALCQEGRESWHSYCSPAQMPVCLHRASPSFSACLSPDPTGVAGGGQAEVQDGCLGLRVSSLILFSVAFSVPLLPHRCALPHCPVSHLHSLSKHLLSAFVCAAVSFCGVFGFGFYVSLWLPSPQSLAFILSLEAHKGTGPNQNCAKSPSPSPARNLLPLHFSAP